jgi:predicted amidophosphoribosyltransferase
VTEPRRLTVNDLAAPYANFLQPVPRVIDGVCPTCRSGALGHDACFHCGRVLPRLQPAGADAVGLIALAPARSQLAYELVNYKREATPAAIRDRFTLGLAAVLWRWLAAHERCLAAAAGVPGFPIITTVPSTNRERRGEHPMVRLVSGIVIGSAERYRPLLSASGIAMGERDYRADRFVVTQRLNGEDVLVIDDTWTSGAQLQGAAAALKAAGAGRVAVLAIGRWYHPDDANNQRVEEARRTQSWDWDRCLFDG